MIARLAAISCTLAMVALGCSFDSTDEPSKQNDSINKEPNCTQAQGNRYIESEGCLAATANAGCTSNPSDDGAITFAQDPNGEIWRFPTTTFPDGWTEIPSSVVPAGTELCEPPESADCGSRPPDACGEGCRPIFANPFNEAAQCWEKWEAVSCVESGLACPSMSVLALDNQDSMWLANRGCMPSGWTSTYPDNLSDLIGLPSCEPSEAIDCASKPPDACGADCLAVTARLFVEDAQCWEQPEAVFCMAFGTDCDDAMHYTLDNSGSIWLFSSGCIHPEWSETHPDTSPDTSLMSLPSCQ